MTDSGAPTPDGPTAEPTVDVAPAPGGGKHAAHARSGGGASRKSLWTRLSSDVGLGALVALATLVVTLMYRRPPLPADQMSYFRAAQSFPDRPEGGYVYWHYLRLGLVVPLRLVQELFGGSEGAYYVLPILFAMMLAVGMFAVGTLLYGRWVGIGAVILMLGNSIIFTELTQLLPDLAATAQFVAAVAIAVAIRQQRPSVSSSTRRRILALVAIGVLLGWSYLTREFIVFCWPLVPLVLWWRVPAATGGSWLKESRWVAAPMAACLAIELAFGALQYGTPFKRMQEVSGHGDSGYADEVADTFRDKPRSEYALRLWDIIGAGPDGRMLHVALLVALIGAVCSPKRLGLLGLWIALLWIPLTMLGGFIDPSAPKLRLQKHRYWFPIYPAFALGASATLALAGRQLLDSIGGAGGTLARSTEKVRGRYAVPVIAVLALLIPVATVVQARAERSDPYRYTRTGATQLPQFRDWLHDHRAEVRTIWTDQRTRNVLPLYFRGLFSRDPFWRGELQVLVKDGPRPVAGDYVVRYSKGREVCRSCNIYFETVYGSPPELPPTWQLVFRTDADQLQVYRVP